MAGADIEQTRVAFGTFMGDVNKGNAMIAKLNEFANVTPFTNDEVLKAGRQFLAAQIPAEQITKTLQMVGDVASGAKIPLTDLAGIYSKAMNKGKVQAEELNQLAERGVPILATFAKMYGISTAEVMKMGEQGKLTSNELTKAFDKMTSEGGMFNKMMEKQAQTVGGKWSTLLGKIGLLFQNLGEKGNKSISRLVDKLISATDFLLKHVDSIVKYVTTIISKIANVFIAIRQGVSWWFDALSKGNPIIIAFTAIMTGVLASMLAYKAYMIVMSTVTKVWTAVQAAFNAVMAMNPIYLIIAGIVALIAAIGYVVYKTDGWGKTWGNVMEYIKSSFEQAGAFLNLKWLQIQNTFLSGFELIQKGWYKLQSLWDKDAANAGLSALNGQSNARAEAILSAKGKVSELAAARKQMKVMELSWNNKTLGGMVGGIKSALGLSAPGMAGAGSAGAAGLGSNRFNH
jgi:tape measure domain-containing protein